MSTACDSRASRTLASTGATRYERGSAPSMRRPVPRPSRVRSRPSASRRRLAQRADALAYARGVLDAEAAAILGAKERLGASFVRALELVRACEGHVVVTGLGKPGFIAQKLSATLASTGVPSLYLHPSEALHGDLGRVSRGDVVLALSNSGSTEELVRLLPSLRRLGAKVVAITGDGESPLAQGADVVLDVGAIPEACPLGLVPDRQLGRAACRVRRAGDDAPQDAPVQQRGVRARSTRAGSSAGA